MSETRRERALSDFKFNGGAPEIPSRYRSASIDDLSGNLRAEIDQWLEHFPDCGPTEGVDFDDPDPTRKYHANEAGNAGGFAIYGPVGTGKTHAVIATLHALVRRFYPCKFVSAPDLSRDFKSSFDDYHDSAEQVIKKYAAASFLAIDDIDKFSPSAFSAECLFSLIDRRHNEGLPILITSNVSPSKLREVFSRFPEFGDAIIDRFHTTTPQWFKLEGVSRRIQRAT